MIGRIHVGQSHDLLLCSHCRNALRKHYVRLRENLHIAVRNADVPDSILVSPKLHPSSFLMCSVTATEEPALARQPGGHT